MLAELVSTTHKMTRRQNRDTNLFVDELSGVFLNVSFIQVGGHVHQTYLWEPKVCQLNVSHGGD